MPWDEECDVLVVGSGAGGMTGAYTAAREGLSVILAESTDRFGGTTAYSGGGMWFPGNAVLRRDGADADMDRARAYYHEVVGNRTPRALQEAYLDTGARLIDYLEADEGFAFITYPWPDYYGGLPTASATGRHIMPAGLPAAAARSQSGEASSSRHVAAGSRMAAANSCHLGDESQTCRANAARMTGMARAGRRRPPTSTTAPIVTT